MDNDQIAHALKYHNLKVYELKELCQRNGLSTTGTKSELCLRLAINELNNKEQKVNNKNDNEMELIIKEIQKALVEKDKELESLKKQLALKDEELNTKIRQLRPKVDELNSLQEQLKSQEPKLKELETTQQMLQRELSKKRSQLNSKESDLDVVSYDEARQIRMLTETIFEIQSNTVQQGLYSLIYMKPNEAPKAIQECLSLIFTTSQTYTILTKCITTIRTNWEKNQISYKFPKHSIDELLSIYLYTTQTKDSIYTNLNTALTRKDRSEISLSNWKHYVYHFFNGLKKLPPFDKSVTLYRGLNVDVVEINKERKRYEVGKKITFYSFISTSQNKAKAEQFMKGSGTLFIINNCLSGRSVEELSHFKEKEVLFPPGATFIITGINININTSQKRTDITMEQVPSIEKKLQFPEES